MRLVHRFWKATLICFLVCLPAGLLAQGTLDDYERAAELRDKLDGLAVDIAGPAEWIEGTSRFWYQKSVKGGSQYVLVDAETKAKGPAFDHERLAASLSAATGEEYKALDLEIFGLSFVDEGKAIEFVAEDSMWKCSLDNYSCSKTGDAPQGRRFRRRGPVDSASIDPGFESPAEFENDVHDGMAYQVPQQGQRRFPFGPGRPEETEKASPDGKLVALIQNYNVFIRPKDGGDDAEATALSWDGSEGNYYTLASIEWSPDSKHLVAYRVVPGYDRQVHYIESSPTDQLQPKHSSRTYAKPGDVVDKAQPVLFHVDSKKQVEIDNSLFPNPYSLSNTEWRKDSRAFTFAYNQRGHQVYRVIEVNASSGAARALISEQSDTFVNYRPISPSGRNTGKIFRHDLDDGKEIIWLSERDGWTHLYLYDGVTGKVKNQITKGEWVVRGVEKVDEENRQIWFMAGGMNSDQDPYFVHYYRINLDGSGLTAITEADGNHSLTLSPDMKYYVDTWSRVDMPTVSELRRTEDKSLVMELEKGNIDDLLAAGWRAPEVFVAKARDGKTDIWGVIYRPTNFDPSKKYPVVETIYAGPQGSFVPKTFSGSMQPLAELGFIVVQMDGMGTANRSKAFHDVAWKNLGDAGFPDRILWHKAVAAKYPYYDISRVGVYGTSAGGQNALGALLFHPEFYKAAVSNSGCHDNRMDKMWWNEQWMSWPLGPHYAESSNVDNAHRLEGKLLLVVPEMDTNVDPTSSWQVVNALIEADKKFDLLFVPGGGHGAGGAYGRRLLNDFFVHHLMGVEPPDWNTMPDTEMTDDAAE